jgi:NADH:ubiquinone oxidoreductase subunit 4 (subunit M)
MLVGIVVLYLYGGRTLDILKLSQIQYPIKMQYLIFMDLWRQDT